MTTGEFWTRAWATLEALNQLEEGDERLPELVEQLRDDLVLQQYIFVHRGWAKTAWFTTFAEIGLFDAPPDVQYTDDAIRTRAWPVMAFVKAAAAEEPTAVAEVLRSLRSLNWWVISDALEAATLLPADAAGPIVLHLLSRWQKAPVTWTHPEVLVNALFRVAEGSNAAVLFPAAVMRVSSRLVVTSSHRYDLDEILRRLETVEQPVRDWIADGLETAIAARARVGTGSSWGPRLRDLDNDRYDAAEVLAAAWLRLVGNETGIIGLNRCLSRAVRLLASSDSLLRQMGIRSLAKVLASDPEDAVALDLLARLAEDQRLLRGDTELAEMLDLFAAHFGLLQLEQRKTFVERLLDWARSEDVLNRYFARDWLYGLQSHLGPLEEGVLTTLAADLGEPHPEAPRYTSIAMFEGSDGPLTSDQASGMSARDLVGYMRDVPKVGGEFRDSSVESVAGVVRAEIERRPEEFIPLLGTIATRVNYPWILHHVVAAFGEVFKNADMRAPDRLDILLAFVRDVTVRANTGDLGSEDQYGYMPSSVVKAVASVLDELAPWLLTVEDPAVLFGAVDAVLASPDPTPEHEAQYGGTNMDPPTLALNTARGHGTRALLRLLTTAGGGEVDGAGRYREALEERAIQRSEVEASPSVLSGFGIFLGPIVYRHPDLSTMVKAKLLSEDADPHQWEAVFATYVLFNRAHRQVAEQIADVYELAVTRLADGSFAFLRKHADRLLNHLIALALPDGAQDNATWEPLLDAALGAAPASEARTALAALGHALERQALDLDRDWVLRLGRRRFNALGPTSGRPEEASGLLELLMDAQIPPVEVGGALLGLMYAGGTLRSWDVVEYLVDADKPRSGMGVQVLARAVEGGHFTSFVRDEAQFDELLSDYAHSQPQLAWPLLNRIGELGMLTVEPIAQRLAADVAASGHG